MAAKKSAEAAAPRLDPRVGQYFETLRHRVLVALGPPAGGCRALALTSCHSGEGVTTVATNFAVALSGGGHSKVLLCDANLESPSIHGQLKMPRAPGLREAVAAPDQAAALVRTTSRPNLDVLPAGDGAMTTYEMVDLPEFAACLEALKARYSFVVFDTPPLIECSATARLGAACDGVILVIEAERQRWEVAERATDLLNRAGAHILGAALNKREFPLPGFLYDRL